MIRPNDLTPEEHRQDAIDDAVHDARTIAEVMWGPVLTRVIEIMKERGFLPPNPLEPFK